MLLYARSSMVVALACILAALVAQGVEAAPFKSRTVIQGTYLMGTGSIAEYDYWAGAYPDYATPFSFTFFKNGTVDIYDEAGGDGDGTYTRFGRGNSRITVTLTSPQSPSGTVTYELYRVGNTDEWWGEVRIDGDVWGHFRGTLD